MAFILDYAKQKAATYLTAGVQAGGTLAGNAVGGVGSLIESSGKNFAQGVQGGISGVGNRINGYGEGIKGSMAADGPVHTGGAAGGAKKTAVKRTAPPGKPGVTTGARGGTAGAPARPKVGEKSSSSPAVEKRGVGSARGVAASGKTSVKSGVPAKTPGSIPVAKGAAGSGRAPVGSGGGLAAARKGPTQTKPGPPAGNKSSAGKVRISPESRPRPAVKAA